MASRSTRKTRAGDDEEPELDEDELLAEEGLKDDRLEARLALAYDVATAGVSSGREHPMKAPEFRKAARTRRPALRADGASRRWRTVARRERHGTPSTRRRRRSGRESPYAVDA